MKEKFDWLQFTVEYEEQVNVEHKYFNYVDYIIESKIPVYVGKGSAARVRHKRARNLKHQHVCKKHNIIRHVVFSTNTEYLALINERKLINDLQTFSSKENLGCNFTTGGEGSSGHNVTREERKKRSERQTGANNIAKLLPVRQKISESLRGKKFSTQRKKNISSALKGRTQSKIERSLRKIVMNKPEVRSKLSSSRRQNFSWLKPIHDRIMTLKESYSYSEICSILSHEFFAQITYGMVKHAVSVHKCNTCKVCSN